jgi:hypothetical protein
MSTAAACSSSPSTPTPTTAPENTPPPTTESGLTAFLAEVDGKVIEIRGIPAPEPVPYRFLDQEELAEFLTVQIEDPETRESIEAADALYKLLGLITQDSDLYEEYTDLLNSQVLGAYDSEAKEFVVLQPGDEFGPLEEITYAHEYVHRLQDAQYDLEKLLDEALVSDDRALALLSLVEGDAVAVQRLYTLQNLDFADLSRIVADSEEALARGEDAPYILQRGLEFPYDEGAEFVNRLVVSNGFKAVDEAFASPPLSTEQVMHAEKYQQREAPVEVSLPESLFGDDWEIVYDNVMGEFFFKTWLEALGAERSVSGPAAAGWGGDRYIVAENESGEHALAMIAVWDSSASDAGEFFLSLTQVLNASEAFSSADSGAEAGIQIFNGPAGVLVVGNLVSGTYGDIVAVTVAPTLAEAMSLLLSSVS